jgi:hypothetical protein
MVTSLREWHRFAEGGLRWRLTTDGVELEPGFHPRTQGEPITIKRIWAKFGEDIQHWALMFGLPMELLLATVATESRADLDPAQDRKEPGYVSDEATTNRVSVGLCHPLISTARAVTGFAVGRAWLGVPRNNLMVAALVLRSDVLATRLDVPLCFAKYNAGALVESPKNPFRLRVTGDHISRALAFFNDAVAVLREKSPHGCARDMGWLLEMQEGGLL